MWRPAGKAGQERVCGDASVLPQCRMPEPAEVGRRQHASPFIFKVMTG